MNDNGWEPSIDIHPIPCRKIINYPLSIINSVGAIAMSDTPLTLTDRSHWGLIRLTGSTRQAFLHNQTTNDFKRLRAGALQNTVWLTSTARVIDFVTVLAEEDAHWMMTSPDRAEILLGWMPRFVFFMDDVKFHNEKGNYAIYSVYGAQSDELLTALGGAPLAKGTHNQMTLAGVENVRVVADSGLKDEGYTFIVPTEPASTLWDAIVAFGATVQSAAEWNDERVRQGRPAADHEMTEEYNPLEVGLWDAVSFAKGCYIGQEIVARLDTYQKLKQQLWGLRLAAPVAAGTPILHEGPEVGTGTSVTSDGTEGLGFIRVKAGGAGLAVTVGDTSADVVDIPFISRGRKDI
jgi:folate-binding protein YgfZ